MKNKILSILIIVFINTTSIAQTFSWLFSDVNNKIVSQSFGGCETKDNIHEGIDLNGYNYVHSICNGIVTFIEEPVIGGGFIVYIKSVENPELTISYAHLVDRQEGVEDGSFIEIGQKLGVVNVSNPSHVHLNFINTNTRIRYNPLINQNFSALLESVDSENKPILGAFYIKLRNTENYEKNYVYSKVDIIREVRDDMGGWYYETIPDYSVFSGNEYRFKGQSADPYKITFSINNTNYPNVFQEFLRINNLSQPNIELFDYDKYAVTLGKDNRHYFCRILTNSFTPNETNETGFDYEERPWQTKLKSGTTNQEALVNWEAEYPDGDYTLHMSAQDVAGNTTTDDKIVPVDNFLPFHRHVKVYEEDTDNLIYDCEWKLNSAGQLESYVAVNALPKEKNLTVEVITSEACSNLKYKLGAFSFYQNATKINDNTFTFSINAPLGSIEEKLRLKSWDLSDNENYKFENIETIYPPVYRIGNEPNDWSNPQEKTELQGTDECNVLKFITANFSYTHGWINKEKISFYDNSTPPEAITSWFWDFDDGETSTEQNPIHKYEEARIYDVTLIVNGVSLKTKRIEIKIEIDCDEIVTAYNDGKHMFGNYYAGRFELSNLIQAPEPVHIIAYQEIVLLPGFETATGQKFIAEIDLDLECKNKATTDSTYTEYNTKNTAVSENEDLEEEIILEGSFISKINVFPNPSNGEFTIDLSQVAENKNKLEIINSIGSVIYSNTSIVSSLINIDISNQSKGIYFIKLYAQNKIYYHKIIHQ